MKQKKAQGLLPEKFLSILIAVLVIVGLFFLIVLLLKSFSGDAQSLEKAKSQLNSLTLAMSKMKEGDVKSIIIDSPTSWEIVAYPNFDLYVRFEQCMVNGEYCLCICSNAWTQNGLYDNCNKEKNCAGFGKSINVKGTSIKIDAKTSIKVSLKNNEYLIERE